MSRTQPWLETSPTCSRMGVQIRRHLSRHLFWNASAWWATACPTFIICLACLTNKQNKTCAGLPPTTALDIQQASRLLDRCRYDYVNSAADLKRVQQRLGRNPETPAILVGTHDIHFVGKPDPAVQNLYSKNILVHTQWGMLCRRPFRPMLSLDQPVVQMDREEEERFRLAGMPINSPAALADEGAHRTDLTVRPSYRPHSAPLKTRTGAPVQAHMHAFSSTIL
jgi:hypothetical protein